MLVRIHSIRMYSIVGYLILNRFCSSIYRVLRYDKFDNEVRR